MPILNESSLEDAKVYFTTEFDKAFESMKMTDPAYDMIAREFRTNVPIVDHKWMGDVPAMTEWLGERPIGQLKGESYRITTKKWANGIEVDEDDLEDDNLALYQPRIQQLAGKTRIHRVNLLMDFLVKGFATTTYGAGYDGQAFFSASHVPASMNGSGDNLLTAELGDTAALDSAIEKMLELTDENGEPLGMYPTHLFYGPSNRATANELIKADRLANGASNTNFNVVTPVMSPKLVGDYAKYWFLADLSKPLKPLIWQVRRDVRFRAVGASNGGMESMESFKTGKLYFGADYRANAGYGFWETIIGSTGTA